MTSRFLIYGLFDPRLPDTAPPRYIGKSSCGLTRPKVHGYKCKIGVNAKFPVNFWITHLKELGLEYVIKVLEETTKRKLINSEIRWISESRKLGGADLNCTDGGEGCPGKIMGMSQVAKLSRLAKARTNPRLGKHHSEATKLKMSRSRGGVPIQDQNGTVYKTQSEASKKLGVQMSHIYRILKGTLKSSHGFSFTYLKGYLTSTKSNTDRCIKVTCSNGITYESVNEAARLLNLKASRILDVLNGGCFRTGGYSFTAAI